jgi:hypothetical protein
MCQTFFGRPTALEGIGGHLRSFAWIQKWGGWPHRFLTSWQSQFQFTGVKNSANLAQSIRTSKPLPLQSSVTWPTSTWIQACDWRSLRMVQFFFHKSHQKRHVQLLKQFMGFYFIDNCVNLFFKDASGDFPDLSCAPCI